MGKTRYTKVVEFLETMKKLKGSLVTRKVFFAGFIMHIGDDVRTRKACISMMKELNLIEERDDGIFIR